MGKDARASYPRPAQAKAAERTGPGPRVGNYPCGESMSTKSTQHSEEKLSVVQVADEIGCHPNTVWNQIRAGQLKAVRFGPRVVRVKRSDLESFLSSYHAAEHSTWLTVKDGLVGR